MTPTGHYHKGSLCGSCCQSFYAALKSFKSLAFHFGSPWLLYQPFFMSTKGNMVQNGLTVRIIISLAPPAKC
jgi:hypothetical protein